MSYLFTRSEMHYMSMKIMDQKRKELTKKQAEEQRQKKEAGQRPDNIVTRQGKKEDV